MSAVDTLFLASRTLIFNEFLLICVSTSITDERLASEELVAFRFDRDAWLGREVISENVGIDFRLWEWGIVPSPNPPSEKVTYLRFDDDCFIGKRFI